MTDHDTAPRTSSDRTGLPVLVVVLGVLCVAALVAAVWLTVWLRGETADNESVAEDRVALRQAAERFTESWNTFEAGQAEQYVENVSPLLSTKFRTEFEDAATDVVTGIEQQQLSSTGKVLTDRDELPLVGIASMDDDSAEVLVVADAQRVSSGQEVVRHWRWQISFVKSDGEWLVDAFEEV
jgi:hypothetical protein